MITIKFFGFFFAFQSRRFSKREKLFFIRFIVCTQDSEPKQQLNPSSSYLCFALPRHPHNHNRLCFSFVLNSYNFYGSSIIILLFLSHCTVVFYICAAFSSQEHFINEGIGRSTRSIRPLIQSNKLPYTLSILVEWRRQKMHGTSQTL